MAGLVPPTRAEALWPELAAIASAGEGPAIHVLHLCHSRESGNPVTTAWDCLLKLGLLDCPVKPGNDK